MKKTYYIRINSSDQAKFEDVIIGLRFDYSLIAMDAVTGMLTNLYSVEMSEDDVLLLKLSFPVKQCITLKVID